MQYSPGSRVRNARYRVVQAAIGFGGPLEFASGRRRGRSSQVSNQQRGKRASRGITHQVSATGSAGRRQSIKLTVFVPANAVYDKILPRHVKWDLLPSDRVKRLHSHQHCRASNHMPASCAGALRACLSLLLLCSCNLATCVVHRFCMYLGSGFKK